MTRSKAIAALDLLLLLSLAAFLAAAIFVVPIGFVRVVLGIPFVLFYPGYALIAALFAHKSELGTVERFGLSIGASFPIAFFIGFALNYTPLGITIHTTFLSVLLFALLCSAVAYHRRMRLSLHERFQMHIQWEMPRWCQTAPLDKVLSVLLLLSILVAVGVLVYAAAKPKTGEHFTELYLLGPAGKAEAYPDESAPGQPITLIIGVVNHEHADVQYRIERLDPSGVEQVADFPLAHDQTWEQPYTFTLTQPGADQRVEFLLYKDGGTEPYRSLHLWITVTSP